MARVFGVCCVVLLLQCSAGKQMSETLQRALSAVRGPSPGAKKLLNIPEDGDNENAKNSNLEHEPEYLPTECDQDQAREPEPEPELDADILTALGETTEEVPKFGPKIHEKLSKLWLPTLKKGINKETKDKLTKEYLIPENCPLLQAPKLNPEISAAVNEGARARDKRVETIQQQLGQGISALNKGLELLIEDGKENKVQAIKYLSDSCRLLCDLHFMESEARKRFVTPGLDKSFLNITQDVDRDDMLFGSKLSEKIKATRVIEKHGLQIKKSVPTPKTQSTPQQPSTSRSRPQGNWGGPSRFPSNRGGRGGPRKTAPPTRRPTQTAQPRPSSTSLNKPRVHQQ